MSAKDISATIIRLPMVYGVGDNWHRLYPYIKRMDDNRPAIVLEETIAHWQGGYGYVENVAQAIALAIDDQKALGRIYNVSESPMSEVDLVRAIAEIIGWEGNMVIIPKNQMPDTWELKENLRQHWVTDSTRIRTELGYTEVVTLQEALKQTILWSRKHPPVSTSYQGHSKLLDYQDEDAILANLKL